MTTTLQHELVYDARMGEVSAMLADPGFREQVADAQGALRRRVTIGGAPREVRIDRVQSTVGVPSFAKRIVTGDLTVHQSEVWSSDTVAVVDITVPGGLATLRGNISLSESDGRTTESVRLNIKVPVPLVGAKLEEYVEELMLKAFDLEQAVGAAYLSR
ncbi:DUF2505 domain-containing protein [Nocardioides sp. KC13]|uniref:DUF2505 domain-containing protein n=1 Tax=Nocardioides turkmenicus TaxID=2711220 RepID=A0A6M1R5J7_9ACTN|nr:DUF2505 domain-containing protein [Nocardioides sp. KC13]NGN95406.1 DUF2505 domain-containing protein [Nocardioides sp. KC13]